MAFSAASGSNSPTSNMFALVDELFQSDVAEHSAHPENLVSLVKQHSAQYFQTCKSLNAEEGWSRVEHGELVRVRCMIQDVKGAELFAASVLRHDERLICGILRDAIECEVLKSVMTTCTRYSYTMVPVPGATDWFVRNFVDETPAASLDENESLLDGCEEKRPRLSVVADESTSRAVPAPLARATFKFRAKFFDESAEDLSPNRVFDVYGIFDNCIAERDKENVNIELDDSLGIARFPSLHVIHYDAVDHHDAVPQAALTASSSSRADGVKAVRETLCSLFGDTLAADYILCHMISTTYSRPEEYPICSMPLNLVNITDGASIIRLLQALTPKVEVLEIHAETLGRELLTSSMDYEKEMLRQGRLQISDGTILLIDETKLPSGPIHLFPDMSEMVIRNIGAINQLVKKQKVEYDYTYYKLPLHCDVNVLILSKRACLLGLEVPFVLAVPPQFADGVDPTAELMKGGEGMMARCRHSLLACRRSVKDVGIGENVNKTITDGFVQMRLTTNSAEASAQLHRLLTLCRLLAALDGKAEVDVACWERAKTMERERLEVLAEFAADNR